MLYTNWNSSKAWQTLLQSVERELGSMEQPGECNQAEDTWMWDSLSSKNEIKKLYIHLLVYVWSKSCFLLCYEELSWIHDWKAWRERPELTHTLCSITTYLLKIIKFLLQNLHLLQISTHFLTGERCFLLIDPLLELIGFTEKHELLAAFFQHAFTFFSQFQERVIPGRSRKGKQGTVRWNWVQSQEFPKYWGPQKWGIPELMPVGLQDELLVQLGMKTVQVPPPHGLHTKMWTLTCNTSLGKCKPKSQPRLG